jgi:hypothetical protein
MPGRPRLTPTDMGLSSLLNQPQLKGNIFFLLSFLGCKTKNQFELCPLKDHSHFLGQIWIKLAENVHSCKKDSTFLFNFEMNTDEEIRG